MTNIAGLDPLDPTTRNRFERLALRSGRPASVLTQEAVSQYLDREEARWGMHDDAVAAWAKFQADGLHVTGEEADAWLAALERGEDIDPPACHV